MSDATEANAGRRTAVAAGWAAMGTVGNTILSFIVFLVLARLLKPAEFGVVAVATVFVDALLVLSRGGLPDAIVQRPELDELYADTAFWVSAGLGVTCCALLMLGSFPIAIIFRMPELQPVLAVLAFTFVIGALGGIHEGRLQRSFGFKRLAMRTLAANTVAGLGAVVMAFHGFGVWSLVAQRLIASTLTMALTILAMPWRPRFRFDKTLARQQVTLGGKVLGSNLLIIMNNRVHELIAAYFLSASAVGLMRMAWRCIDLVSQVAVIPLAQVALPTYARVQGDPEVLEARFKGLVSASAILAMPAFLGIAAVAPILLPVVFGPQWADAAPVLQILCLLAPAFVVNSFVWPLLVSVNRAGVGVTLSAAQLAVGAAASFVAGPFGLVAISVTHVFRAYAFWPAILYLSRRFASVRSKTVLVAVGLPFVAAMAMAMVIALVVRGLTPHLGHVPLLLSSISLGAVIYAALILVLAPKLVEPAKEKLLSLVLRRRVAV